MKNKMFCIAIVALLSMIIVSCKEKVVEPDDTTNDKKPHIDTLTFLPLEYLHSFRIFGSNFDSLKAENRVFINDREVESVYYNYWSDTLIEMKLPYWAVNGELFIKKGSLKSNKFSFTIKDYPFIYSVLPSHCLIGDTLVIRGHYLGDYNPDSSVVRINSVDYMPIFWNDSLIHCIVPDNGSKRDEEIVIFAIRGKKGAGPLRSNIIREPLIETITPEISLPQSRITITGLNLTLLSRNQEDSPGVYLNGEKIEKTDYIDSKKIIFNLPNGAKSGDIYVRRFGMQSNRVNLSVMEEPVLESIKPGEGKTGDEVVITGKNFTDIKGKVYFKDKLADIVMWSDSRIVCKIPEIYHNLYVFVEVSGYKTNEVLFLYPGSKTMNNYNFRYVVVKSVLYDSFLDTLAYKNGNYVFQLRRNNDDRDYSVCHVVFDSLTMYLKEAYISYDFVEMGAGGIINYYRKTTYTIRAKDIPVVRMDDISADYLISKIYANKINITYVVTGNWKNNKTGESGIYDEKGVVESNTISDYEFHFY